METEPTKTGCEFAGPRGVEDPAAATPAWDTLPGTLLAAVDCVGAGLVICDAQRADCPIVHVSNGFSVITRYTAPEAVGLGLGFLLAPENSAATVGQFRAVLARGGKFCGEFLCRRREGGPVVCELMLTPLPAPDGGLRHIAALLTDITERKRREEQLKEAEARYRGIFENAVEGIYQSTPDGHYLAVNPALAKMYGYSSPEEMLNTVSDISHQIYVDPAYRDRFRSEVEEKGEVRGLEYQVRCRDGSIIWISESARVVRDARGAARYYEGFIDDITPRKEAEQARARLEKQMVQTQKMEAMGTLAGGIAHDFNNILCAMLGMTELALASAELTGQTRKNLDAVLKSAGRAKDLVKQILTFSRYRESERHPLKIRVILKECVKLLNASLPSSIEIVSTVDTEDDTVLADATEMHQLIMNLGTNAAHAMRSRGGRLEYRLESVQVTDEQARLSPLEAGPHMRLTVRDTGHGMSPDVMENIFDPFFTTKPPGEGTGLGLTLVQRIVANGGGHITVESRENYGTTFQIYFPRAEATVVDGPVKHEVIPGRHERLLVVDDEILILSMMQQHLRKMGYRVITRADSVSALDSFREEPDRYDLVITDHTMPGMLGSELAEKLGAIRANVPVILITGMNQPPNFAGSHFAARRAVVRKPIDFVDLSHRIREQLEPVQAAGGEQGGAG
jgi:PAS domain S-box-containing protein